MAFRRRLLPALLALAVIGAGTLPAPALVLVDPNDPSAQYYGVPIGERRNCRKIANAEANKPIMAAVALFYYHGYDDGRNCTRVDYLRAFELLRKANATQHYDILLKDLRKKAKAGDPAAIEALATLAP